MSLRKRNSGRLGNLKFFHGVCIKLITEKGIVRALLAESDMSNCLRSRGISPETDWAAAERAYTHASWVDAAMSFEAMQPQLLQGEARVVALATL